MTGSLLPLWAWLAIGQAVIFVTLFEYVRRNIGPEPRTPIEVPPPAEAELLGHQKLAALIARKEFLRVRYERAQEIVRERRPALQNWWKRAREKPVGHIMGLADGLRGNGGASGMEFPQLFSDMGLAVPDPPFALGFHDLSGTAYRDAPIMEQLKVDSLITRHEQFTNECMQLLGPISLELAEIERQIEQMGTSHG